MERQSFIDFFPEADQNLSINISYGPDKFRWLDTWAHKHQSDVVVTMQASLTKTVGL